MNKLMTTTAVALLLGNASAMAEQHTSGTTFPEYAVQEQSDLFASDLLGARIYATETEVGDTIEDGAEQEWDDLGEINDMILNSDGTVQVVILGIGGFLGLGERDVAVDMTQIKIVRDGADPTDYFLVVNATQDAIENAPEFNRSGPADEAMAEGEAATEAAAEETEQAAENAAAEAEQAAEETEQAAEDAANEAEQAAEGAAAEVDQAAEETEQAAEDVANEAEQAAEGAAAEVDQAAEETEQAAEDAANEAEQAVDEATDTTETQN